MRDKSEYLPEAIAFRSLRDNRPKCLMRNFRSDRDCFTFRSSSTPIFSRLSFAVAGIVFLEIWPFSENHLLSR